VKSKVKHCSTIKIKEEDLRGSLTINSRLHGVTLHTVNFMTTYGSRWPYVDSSLYYTQTMQSKQLNVTQGDRSSSRDEYHHYHHYHSVSLKTGSQPLPKCVLQTGQSIAFLLSSKLSHCFVNVIQEHITSSSSFPVTSPFPCIFPSTTRFRMQLFRKM